MVEAELAAIAAEGVSDDELDRVRTMRIASFFFALEHMGGFGGVADRLNAYNVFRGDPSLITSDVQTVSNVSPPTSFSDVAARISRTAGPASSLSVVGRRESRRSQLARSGGRSRQPRSPRVIARHARRSSTLACGIPLWVFPRRDLPTVAGIDHHRGGGEPADADSRPGSPS